MLKVLIIPSLGLVTRRVGFKPYFVSKVLSGIGSKKIYKKSSDRQKEIDSKITLNESDRNNNVENKKTI